MNRRIVILTEIIAPYRIPVFNVLSQMDHVTLHVIFLAETDPGVRDWPVYKDEIKFSYEVLPSRRVRIGGANILLNRGLTAALRSCRPDVLVCGGYNYLASWQALYWARRNSVPFFLWAESHARDARRNNPIIEAAKRNFIGRCEGFIVPGKASFDYLRCFKARTFDGLARAIFKAPNAVDNDFFGNTAASVRREPARRRQQLKLPERFFLFVGRMIREKGIFDLLNAYRGMNPELRSQVGLILAGDGPVRAEAESFAKDISSDMIMFPGFLQRETLANYFALAEAMILPTHSDTWGLVVNEAMACGLPVICTEVAGCVPDLLEDGWNGYVVGKSDVGELTAALEELAKDSDRCRAMGGNSAARIRDYTPLACANGIAEAAFSRSAS